MTRVVSILAFLLFAAPAGAQEDVTTEFDTAMKQLADEAAGFIKTAEEAKGRLMIGNFSGPVNTSAGSKIVESLKANLEGRVQVVDLGSAFSLSGEYRGGTRDGQFVTVIEASIKDGFGNQARELRKKIVTSVEVGLAFFGATVELAKPEAEETVPIYKEDAAKKVARSVLSPTVVPEKPKAPLPTADPAARTVAKASPGSPHGVELLVFDPKTNDYAPAPFENKALDAGFAKVAIEPNQTYAIRIHNESDRFVGAAVTIDGINVFHFSKNPAFKSLGKVAIFPGSAPMIKGWHHEGETSFAFLVTNYGDSAAARLGSLEGIGTITVTFYDTAKTRDASAIPGNTPGTTQGEKVTMKYKNLSNLRFTNPLGAVSIRYTRPVHPQDLPEE